MEVKDIDAAILQVLYKSRPLTPDEIRKEIKTRYGESVSVQEIQDRIAVMIRRGEIVYSTVEAI